MDVAQFLGYNFSVVTSLTFFSTWEAPGGWAVSPGDPAVSEVVLATAASPRSWSSHLICRSVLPLTCGCVPILTGQQGRGRLRVQGQVSAGI